MHKCHIVGKGVVESKPTEHAPQIKVHIDLQQLKGQEDSQKEGRDKGCQLQDSWERKRVKIHRANLLIG